MNTTGSIRPHLLLVAGLLSSAATPAAESNAPDVPPDKLAAFIEQWKTYRPLQVPMADSDRPLLLVALAKDPAGPWAGYLISQAAETRFQLRQAAPDNRKGLALAILPTLNQADDLLAKVCATNRDNTALRESQNSIQTYLALFSLEAGSDLDRFRDMALRQLNEAKATNDWNYGNTVYQANELLGRIALRQGNREQARRYLRAAGHTPGSPQLNTFGPDLLLARELLEHGTNDDRDTVLAFLDDVATFWPNPQNIRTWKEQIRAGQIPDDSAH